MFFYDILTFRADKNTAFTEASKLLPKTKGKKVHTSTIWRWCQHGHKGVKLEYHRLGRLLCTSVEALERFSAQLSKNDILLEKTSKKAPLKKTTTHDQKVNAFLDNQGL